MDNVVYRILKLKSIRRDKLLVCQLDVGRGDPVQVVTGADNVFEGALVPVALHDSRLPNGMHIKKGKLRGVESNGMLCSGEELCLKEDDYEGAEVHGILILKEDCQPGTDMRSVLGLDDVIIDFSVTANRRLPDMLDRARGRRCAGRSLRRPQPAYKTKAGCKRLYSVTD